MNNKRGSQLVEASIVMPLIILIIILMLRVLVFYLEIINMGVKEHEEAFSRWDESEAAVIEIYETEESVSLLPGGILESEFGKTLQVKAYFLNEDAFVRAHSVLKEYGQA